MGKTALVVHAAHRLAPRYPDGQLYASLRGASRDPADPADVLAVLLRALGVGGSALPAALDASAGLFRSRLAGRRMLLVLDDAEGYRQLEPLLPAGGGAVMVTSRPPLTGLPGVTAMDLPPLPAPAAVELLGRVAGVARVRGEPAAACGGLPLAVRIAGARLAARPHWTVRTLADRLADERHRLDELRHRDLAVRPGLSLAYRALAPAAARAFVLLGALDLATFPEWPVAALLGVPPVGGAAALEELIDARLLDQLGRDPAGQRRYRFHDVTRLFALERRATDVARHDWVAALSRVAGGWLALARQAQDKLHCDRLYLDDRSVPAAVADPRAAARSLAGALLADGQVAEAQQVARLAAGQFEQIGDPIGAAQGWRVLGEALSRDEDRLAEAEQALALAAARFRDCGYEWGLALTELNLGEIEARRGRDGAADRLRGCLRYWVREQVPALQARTLVALGSVAERSGDPAARDLLAEAHRLYQEMNAPEADQLATRLGAQSPAR